MKRSRKQRIDAAIAYALDRRWELAADENRSLLEEFPDDLEAANRLGKALTELGDLDGAAAAYQRSLELDSTNVIARRNLARIEEMRGAAGKRRPARRGSSSAPAPAVRPHSLIEESGKSAEFDLIEPNAQGLRRVSAGEPAELVPTARGISVQTPTGVVLGRIETRAGLRLKRLIEGGNRYAAVIRRVSDTEGTIYVRETHRDPALVDQPSFLPPAAASAKRRLMPRAYTKSSIVRYGADDLDGDDMDDDEGDGGWTPRPRRSEEDDFDDAGFSDSTADSEDEDEDADPLEDDDDDVVVAEDDDEPIVADEDED
ncbi:MAG: tetratricopeptide repeat protein [Dehalococcoidia bacterium]